jgi:hypothetical protein
MEKMGGLLQICTVMEFAFVVLQSDITCAPQHTNWRRVKNKLYFSTWYSVWFVFSAPYGFLGFVFITVGHFACFSAHKMATCKDRAVFKHMV